MSNLKIDIATGLGTVSALTAPTKTEIEGAQKGALFGKVAVLGLKLAGIFMLLRSRKVNEQLPRRERKDVKSLVDHVIGAIGKDWITKSDLNRKGLIAWLNALAPSKDGGGSPVTPWLIIAKDGSLANVKLASNGTDGLASFGQLRALYKVHASSEFIGSQGTKSKSVDEIDAAKAQKTTEKLLDGSSLEGCIGALKAALEAVKNRIEGVANGRTTEELSAIAIALNGAGSTLVHIGTAIGAIVEAEEGKRSGGTKDKAPKAA